MQTGLCKGIWLNCKKIRLILIWFTLTPHEGEGGVQEVKIPCCVNTCILTILCGIKGKKVKKNQSDPESKFSLNYLLIVLQIIITSSALQPDHNQRKKNNKNFMDWPRSFHLKGTKAVVHTARYNLPLGPPPSLRPSEA